MELKDALKEIEKLKKDVSKEIDVKVSLSKLLDDERKKVDELRKELEISTKPPRETKKPDFKKMMRGR